MQDGDDDDDDETYHSDTAVQQKQVTPAQMQQQVPVNHVLDNLGSFQYVEANGADIQRAKSALLKWLGVLEDPDC